MLLNNFQGFGYSLAVCKYIAEIIFRDDLYRLRTLHDTNIGDIMRFVRSTNPDLDGFEGLCLYLERQIGITGPELGKFKSRFAEYILNFQSSRLVAEYLVVPMAEDAARAKVTNLVSAKLGKRKEISDAVWSQIFLNLKKQFTERTYNSTYDPASGNPIPFIVHAIEAFFFKNIPSDIMESLWNRGLNQEAEGADFSAIDYHSEKMDLSKDLKDFDILASKIYRTTDFLYRHNREVFYDLFSREKFKIVQERASRLRAIIEKRFRFASLRSDHTIVDANLVVSVKRAESAIEYARKKLVARNKILAPMDSYISGVAGLDQLEAIITDMFRVNSQYVQDGARDKLPIFEEGAYKPKDSLNNSEKVEALFEAANALLQFFKYLRENHINPLSVPSDAFRDQKILRRSSSFNWYMLALDDIKQLISGETSQPALVSNDVVYSDLISKGSNTVFNGIPLKGIKDVIDSMTKAAEPKNTEIVDHGILGRAYNNWYACKHQSPPTTDLRGRIKTELEGHAILKQFFLGKNIISHDGMYWHVNTDTDLNDYFRAAYRKPGTEFRLEAAQLFAGIYVGTGKEKYLGYLRTVEFMNKFLDMVRDILGVLFRRKDDTPVHIDTKFYLFRIINRYRYLFDLPSSPSHYTEFETFLEKYNVEYYVSENTNAMEFNEHFLVLYRLMYRVFDELMTYVRHLYRTVYKDYSHGIPVERVESQDLKLRLREIGITLYPGATVTEQECPSFARIKRLSTVDPDTGFLMRQRKYYTREEGSVVHYLHEKGYWVYLSNESHQAYPVQEADFSDA